MTAPAAEPAASRFDELCAQIETLGELKALKERYAATGDRRIIEQARRLRAAVVAKNERLGIELPPRRADKQLRLL